MAEQQTYLEPIRAAALAILAAQPPLTEWNAGEEDDGEIVDHAVESILQEIGWPTRTKTFTVGVTVFKAGSFQKEPCESTNRYFPGSWLALLDEYIARHVQTRDEGQEPDVPDHLRFRKLPQGANFDAFRDLIEGAWEHAWDELACSIAIMHPCDATGMDGTRLNMATYFWYGLHAFDHEFTPPRNDEALSYEERLRKVEQDSFSDLRNLSSPKWRAWFEDIWADRVAIHDTLRQCGVEVTSHLGTDLRRAAYTFDADTSHMNVEELVTRLEARHRFFASAFRAGHSPVGENQGVVGKQSTFAPKRVSNRPANWDAIMEMVAQLKRENVRWKEIRERVQAAHGYPFDSDEALRKQFERWQRSRASVG